MAGFVSDTELLRAIAQNQIPRAVELAQGLSIDAVVDALESTAAPEHPESCDAFVEAWLESLSPFERLSAATKTTHIYLLELFWLPQAADKMTMRTLAAGAAAMTSLKDVLSDLPLTADIPEATFSQEFASGFKRLGETELAALAQRLDEGSRAVKIHE
ncbi:hypothetical protein [Leucobacter luti]|uniref:Uncharacterized protein n=1 Tax=Leucobacter luti TaxID=340320 RepID=A0A4R6S2F5_9MICO|nr:hypothetical protein [Leucobacter luti]QYM75021.1 hypothetical protein K1X41_10060 [Leucobacter luti]TDP93424.1 hypothetical protein EDF62_1403 [Leucobacter luti]